MLAAFSPMSARRWFCRGLIGCLAVGGIAANAYKVSISTGTKAIYLQVGNGTYTGTGNSGTPGNNATINVVSLTLAGNVLGNGTPQQMTSNSTAATSYIDGYAACNPPAQVYVGGWSRTSSGNATMSVSSPAALNSSSDTIPFSQISWTSTENGSTSVDVAAGTFNGGSVALASIAPNTWIENCHTFRYANGVIPAAGTYTGRATYTISQP